jgi:hypothetical protein
VSLHAQALVVTADPSARGEQLTRELSGAYRTEWAAEAGRIAGGSATCDLHSWPDALRLDAFAETDADLTDLERAVTVAVERIGRSENLHVDWYRRPTS